MIWKSSYIHPKGWSFVIEYEKVWDSIGLKHVDLYYLIVFDEEDKDHYNYFQHSLDAAQSKAERQFDVPLDSWEETDEPSRYV